MKAYISDRILSVISYYTFGIFAIIVLIFFQVSNKKTEQFLLYHILQSIFISAVLACISAVYSFLFNLIIKLPVDAVFLKSSLVNFDVFLNRAPIFYTFSFTGFIVMILITYLSIFALMGKKSYLPFISDVIKSNIR